MKDITKTELIKSLENEIKKLTNDSDITQQAKNLLLQVGIAGIQIGLETAKKIYRSTYNS